MYQDKVSFKVSCEKHRRYDPIKSGQGGIKGGCEMCGRIYDLFQYMSYTRFKIKNIGELKR